MDLLFLLAGLFFCHLLGDFSPLSTSWMLQAKSAGKPLLPILAHASVHGILMGIFLAAAGLRGEVVLQLAAFQTGSHFLIDVWKGRMGVWFPALAKMDKPGFWFLFGFDQFLHALVILMMGTRTGL